MSSFPHWLWLQSKLITNNYIHADGQQMPQCVVSDTQRLLQTNMQFPLESLVWTSVWPADFFWSVHAAKHQEPFMKTGQAMQLIDEELIPIVIVASSPAD